MELTIRYRPVGIGKFRFMSNMERSLLGFQDMGFQEKDVDDVKGLIVDTEMSILLLTFTVSAFHLLFDALGKILKLIICFQFVSSFQKRCFLLA